MASTNPDDPDGSFRRTILNGASTAAGVPPQWHVLVIDSDSPNGTVPGSESIPRTIILDGFTVTGGEAFATTVFDPVEATQGAGLYVSNVNNPSNILLENLIVDGNEAGGSGGGLYIRNNSVDFDSLDSQYVRVRHCRFLNNDAEVGGGLTLNGGLVIANCKFKGNGSSGIFGPTGTLTEKGGAMALTAEARLDAANLLIVSNEAKQGGATYYTPTGPFDPTPTLTVWKNCTFADNRCTDTFPISCFGGVVIEGGGSSPETTNGTLSFVSYENCIFWGNQGADLAYVAGGSSGPLLHVEYCDVGVAALAYPAMSQNLDYDPDGNNLSIDPQFVNAMAGNYKLRYELNEPTKASPCIDAGKDGSRGLDPADLNDDAVTSGLMGLLDFDCRRVDLLATPSFAGHPRVVNVATSNAPPFGENIDMGAFERDSAVAGVQ